MFALDPQHAHKLTNPKPKTKLQKPGKLLSITVIPISKWGKQGNVP